TCTSLACPIVLQICSRLKHASLLQDAYSNQRVMSLRTRAKQHAVRSHSRATPSQQHATPTEPATSLTASRKGLNRCVFHIVTSLLGELSKDCSRYYE